MFTLCNKNLENNGSQMKISNTLVSQHLVEKYLWQMREVLPKTMFQFEKYFTIRLTNLQNFCVQPSCKSKSFPTSLKILRYQLGETLFLSANTSRISVLQTVESPNFSS